jgi:putative hydrolase of the HAD superfamily
MNKPLGVLFDLGDTVAEYYYNNPIEGTKKILEVSDNPHKITAEEIQELVVKFSKGTIERRDETNLEICFKSFQRLLYEYFDIWFKVDIDEIEKIFCKYAYKSRPSEGIQELFKTLDAFNIKYGALSNSSFTRDTLKYELEGINLNPNFQFIISSSDYCFRKPNKIIFELAQRKLSFKAEDIWFIGDSYKYDIEGSKNAGMFPIWYNRKNMSVDRKVDCIEVKSIREITELINDIYASLK